MRWPWLGRHDRSRAQRGRVDQVDRRADQVLEKASRVAGKAASNAERADVIRRENGYGALLLESYALREHKVRLPWKR